ncbi:MAG: hypothetical protein AB7S44_04255 [Spirochaetales bacterium]
MQIKSRLYPYPIIDRWTNLVSPTEDYQQTVFETNVETEIGQTEIILKFSAEIKNNEQIKKMIEDGSLAYAFHVECPKTSFRKLYTFNKRNFEEIFDSGQLDIKVEVSPFIIATKNIENFENNDWHNDYKEIQFFIEKGSVLGTGRQQNINITKQKDELADVPSIFSVCVHNNEIDKEMSISINSNNISIALPKAEFEKYQLIKKFTDYQKLGHALIVFPALVYVLEQLKQASEDMIDEYSERGWYRSIKKAMEKRGFNFENLKEMETYKWAQILIEYPLYDSFDQLLKDGKVGGIE